VHDTPLVGIPVPDLGDAANIPLHFSNAFVDAEKFLIIPCTSTTRPAAPHTGMTIYETNTGMHRVWTGTTWKPVQASVLSAIGTTWAGGTPDLTTTQIRTIAETKVFTTNGSGDGTITFPGGGFPTGLITAVVSSGDVTAGAITVGLTSGTKTAIGVRVFSDVVTNPLGGYGIIR